MIAHLIASCFYVACPVLAQAKLGDESELHVIIFDEIDAICKSRGSVRDGSGVHDTVVNQLLTKVPFRRYCPCCKLIG